MVNRTMPRIQEVILPVLREQLPHVQVTSWVPAIEDRHFPILNVRRVGGTARDVKRIDRATIEMTAYGDEDLMATEAVLLDARDVLEDMVNKQIVTEKGHLSSYYETMGPTQFDSPFEGTWRFQMLTQLGLRPPRFT